MKRKSFKYRMLALFVAFLLLPLMFSAQSSVRVKDDSQNSFQAYDMLPCDFNCNGLIVTSKELICTNNVRITRCEVLRSQYQPRCFDYCFKGNPCLICAAVLLYMIIYSSRRKLCLSRRFIIKFIHDQDGHKIVTPFY